MQLKSQEMRKLAPELDPLRIGTGWTKEDLGKVQVMVEKVDLEHVTIVQISATVKVREQTESTTVWQAVR